MVCRNSAMPWRLVEVLLRERVEHRVDPLAVLQVRTTLHALAHVAGALGMRDRALVEGVDLQLDAMEAQLAQQEALEQLRRLDADPPLAESGMHGEAAGGRDPVLLAHPLEGDAAGALAVDLDHEPPELLGRTREVGECGAARVGHAVAEEAPRVVVVDELDEEVDVVSRRAAERDHGVCAIGVLPGSRSAPEPSATPPRIVASPTSFCHVSGSERNSP